jgi:hypothetical protein
MKRRTLTALTALAALPWLVGTAVATPPAVPLQVEWRWVDALLPPAAQAGVRDGAVIVGTAGSVSPHGAGIVTRTAPPAPPPVQQLLVMNGQQAARQLTSRERLQWVDALVELDPTGRTPRALHAQPRLGERTQVQRLSVTPTWPGGRAPVRVVLDVTDGDLALQTTLDLPLAQWHTVARSAPPLAPAERGTLNSRDAAAQPARELQLRVSPAPSLTER